MKNIKNNYASKMNKFREKWERKQFDVISGEPKISFI